TSQKYRYSLQVPEMWSSGSDYDADGESVMSSKVLSFEGGSLTITADDRSGLEEVLNRTEKDYKNNAENDAAYVYQETDENLFGTTAKKFAVQYKSKN